MKIGIYLADLPAQIGGANRFQIQAVDALAGRGDSPHDFCTIGHSRESRFSLPHVFVPLPPLPTRVRKLLERARVIAAPSQPALSVIADNQIDLIYSPHHQTLTTSVPYVVTCWDLQHRLQPFFPEVSVVGWDWDSREKHFREVFSKAAAIVTGTHQGAEELRQFYGIPSERTCRIPFFRPDALAACEPSKPKAFPERRFILYPAQFWPHKNHITILLALKHLQEHSSLRLTAVFPGAGQPENACTLKYVTETAASLGVDAIFPGFVIDGELRWLYENCEALVFASLFGPDNLPPLEAMSLNCPVIASDVPGAREQYGDAARLVAPGDEFEMAAAIQEVIENDDVRRHLLRRGRELTDKLTSSAYAMSLIHLFDKLSRYLRCWKSGVGSLNK